LFSFIVGGPPSNAKMLKVGKYLPQQWGKPPGQDCKATLFLLELVALLGDNGTSFP